MTQLNKTPFQILLRRGNKADLKSSTLMFQTEGEPAFTTDTHQFFISDGSKFNKVTDYHYPDIVCFGDQVVSNNNEIVWI
jgi:hypothetical protein